MKILVTGATGYIGSHFVKTACEYGLDVVATDFNFRQNDINQYASRVFYWDIRKKGIPEEFDKVIHIAAQGKVPYSMVNPWLYYDTNVNGTKHVIDAGKCEHFIYCSTGAAFDPKASPYAATKYGGESLTKQFYPNSNSIVRFYNVTGNAGFHKFDDEYSHLVRRAAATMNGRFDDITIHGTDYDTRDGTCIRNYTHVTDIVDSLLRIAINKPTGKIDYLGSPNGYTVKEVLSTMEEITNKKFNIKMGPRRLGDIPISTVPEQSIYFRQTKTLHDMCQDALEHEK